MEALENTERVISEWLEVALRTFTLRIIKRDCKKTSGGCGHFLGLSK